MESTAIDIIKDHGQMKARRGVFENHWQEICELVSPEYATFTARYAEGEERHNRIFDIKTNQAIRIYASILNMLLTPRGKEWHKIRAKNDNLKDDVRISSFLEKFTKSLFAYRYAPDANFASQVDVMYVLDGLVGNSCLYVDGNRATGMRYRNIHPKEIFVKPNHQGLTDHVHRAFTLKGYQALQQFGDDLPEKMRDKSSADKDFEFIHCVKTNDDFDPQSLLPEKQRFISYYVSLDSPKIIRTGGFRTMPYIYSRHMVAPDEDYGRSPAMALMPHIKMLNEKQRTNIRAAQYAIQPAIMLGDVSHVQPFNFRSGALNYGYLLQDGREMAKPFDMRTRPDIGLDIIKNDHAIIEESFFVNMMQILEERPNMTATEVLERSQEKAQLLTPIMGRKQSEFLGKLIEREIDVMSFNFGLLDDMPEELAGDSIEFNYETELTRVMQASEGVGIMRTIETALKIGQYDQSVLQTIKFDEAIREISKINGMPQKLMKSREEVETLIAEQQQQQQMQQAASMAQQLAPAAKVASEMGMI